MINSHSGNVKDVIYCLPVLRDIGNTELLLNTDKNNQINLFGKVLLSEKSASMLCDLLKKQSYINNCEAIDGVDPSNYENYTDLDASWAVMDTSKDKNIVKSYFKLLNRNYPESINPFISVDENVDPEYGIDVVISRTINKNTEVSYKEIIDKILKEDKDISINNIVFVGSNECHEDMCKEIGFDLFHFKPKNIEDALNLVNSSKLYVGNDNVCTALAYGLGKKTILEHGEDIFLDENENLEYWHNYIKDKDMKNKPEEEEVGN